MSIFLSVFLTVVDAVLSLPMKNKTAVITEDTSNPGMVLRWQVVEIVSSRVFFSLLLSGLGFGVFGAFLPSVSSASCAVFEGLASIPPSAQEM